MSAFFSRLFLRLICLRWRYLNSCQILFPPFLLLAPTQIKTQLRITEVVFYWSGLRVSEAKTTDCCLSERCETKQGERRAVDLRRRWLTTMRLEWNSNSVIRGSNSPPDCYSLPLLLLTPYHE